MSQRGSSAVCDASVPVSDTANCEVIAGKSSGAKDTWVRGPLQPPRHRAAGPPTAPMQPQCARSAFPACHDSAHAPVLPLRSRPSMADGAAPASGEDSREASVPPAPKRPRLEQHNHAGEATTELPVRPPTAMLLAPTSDKHFVASVFWAFASGALQLPAMCARHIHSKWNPQQDFRLVHSFSTSPLDDVVQIRRQFGEEAESRLCRPLRHKAHEMYALVSWHCAGLLFQLQAQVSGHDVDLTWYRAQMQLGNSSLDPGTMQAVDENMRAELTTHFERLPMAATEAVNSYNFSTSQYTRYRLRPHIAPESLRLHPKQLR
jgi:hypothetical protein